MPATRNPGPGKRSAAAGDATKARIVAAALACLSEEGIAGVSARAIARRGDFNQALIFYHFGSVDGLLVAASQEESRERAERYTGRLEEVRTLPELVAIAKELHDNEQVAGSTSTLVQLIAGAASSAELRAGIYEGFRPWMELVEATVTRVLDDTPLSGVVPAADMSLAITAMFLGLELLDGLDADAARTDSLFVTLRTLGTLVEALLQMIPSGMVEAAAPTNAS